jgi:hypothetical protein
VAAFVSPATRFVASLTNATKRPSAEIEGREEPSEPSLCAPPGPTLTRSVVPETRSRTKTSAHPFVSPATRFEARLRNATYRPSAEIDGVVLSRSACAPEEPTLARVVVCALAAATAESARPRAPVARRSVRHLHRTTLLRRTRV